jgi:hypothetical protein
MNLDWRFRLILLRLGEGYTFEQAALSGRVSRQAIWKRMKSHPEFAQAVTEARETGKEERTYRLWLRHPFRGKRPPQGKGRGGPPSFTYGRR